jgi:hypothetical protein
MSINTKRLINNTGILICPILYCLIMLCLFMPTSQAAEITLYPSGGSHDEQQIAEALQNYDTVYLSSGTFLLSNSLYVNDGARLIGQGMNKTTLKMANPSLLYFKGAAIIYINGQKNVEFSGFTVHGGETAETNRENSGHDWGNAILIDGGSSGCSFHDLYFTRLDGDALRVSGYTSDNEVYNCVADTTGHDFVQLWGGSDWHIYNNLVNLNINTGVRFANSENCELDHNTFYCNTGSGFVATELEDSLQGIDIHDNIYRDLNNPYHCGIGTVHATGSDVNIYQNIFYDCTPTAIGGIEYTFENNAYELGAIDGAGYDPNYSTGIIATISSYLTPITKTLFLSTPSLSTVSTTSENTSAETTNSTTTEEIQEVQPQNETKESTWITFQNFPGFINDIISVIHEGYSIIDKFVICLFIMAGAYLIVWIFAKVLSLI